RIYRATGTGTLTFTLVGTLNDNASRSFTDTVNGTTIPAAGAGTGTAPDVGTANTTAADSGAPGTLAAGVYTYRFTFVDKSGNETNASPNVATGPVAASHGVLLTRIPASLTAGTVARRIYRSNDNGATFTLVATLNDNSTTTFTDTG